MKAKLRRSAPSAELCGEVQAGESDSQDWTGFRDSHTLQCLSGLIENAPTQGASILVEEMQRFLRYGHQQEGSPT